MLKRRLDLWLPTYAASTPTRVARRIGRALGHTHIIFVVCDHFEPRHGAHTPEQSAQRMKTWHEGYASFQERCHERFQTTPLHTWFYPPHHGTEYLNDLAHMAHGGLGEVELHYHHDGDNEITLERDLRQTVSEYNSWGLLLSSGQTPRTSFGFIHGDWALCNSGAGEHCGVNNELEILKKLGCWADLTMPSAQHCQTRKINSIYYATGDARQPKSHDWGINAKAGCPNSNGLMLIQGPLAINWRAPSYPRIENASLTSENWGRPDRIRKWIDCHVHVQGRPEWLFIKLHTHGAIEKDFDALFGEKALQMHAVLNQSYNDGKKYSLHYATARQAYNIAKAAEDGHAGNPSDYFDYSIPRPATYYYAVNARHKLEHCLPEHLKLSSIHGATQGVEIKTRIGPIARLKGMISSYEVDALSKRIYIGASGVVSITLQTGSEREISEDSSHRISSDGHIWNTLVGHNCELTYH